jgi:hypothetical protein
MKTPEGQIRSIRRNAKSWLAILTYNCARSQNQIDTFSQKLRSLAEPLFKSEILQVVIENAIPRPPSHKETPNLKKRVMSRIASKKVKSRLLRFLGILDSKTMVKAEQNPLTLGRLVVTWAVLTDQPPQDFMVGVYPSINRLYEEWRETTGCCGFSDEDYHGHPEESAKFWSGFYRTLIQVTPQENLKHFMEGGIQALGAVIETGGLDKTIYDLLGQATCSVTTDITERIEIALRANPDARYRINIPEFRALVLREETKIGCSKNNDKEALKILLESLSPELKEVVDKKDEILKNSMETIGRRGLLNNLEAALSGQLRPRFVESITRFLKSIKSTTSIWEFDTCALTNENVDSLRRWLFRR